MANSAEPSTIMAFKGATSAVDKLEAASRSSESESAAWSETAAGASSASVRTGLMEGCKGPFSGVLSPPSWHASAKNKCSYPFTTAISDTEMNNTDVKIIIRGYNIAKVAYASY